MLVLSRKTDQEFLFPNLGIKIQVMQIKGRLVKIGIEAPEAITVLRSEILADQSIDKHRLRNELNLLQLKIDAIQLRLNRGAEMEAEPVLNQLCDSAGELEQSIAGTSFATDMDSSDPIRLLVVEDSSTLHMYEEYSEKMCLCRHVCIYDLCAIRRFAFLNLFFAWWRAPAPIG